MRDLAELNQINSKLESLFSGENVIFESIKEFINSGSKRIRSILAILYLKSNNKKITDDIIKLLAVGEIIHNASLLHDDILDNSDKRRGKETIGHKFSSQVSILAGDFLLSLGTKILLELNNKAILQNFTKCTEKMCRAEISQHLLKGHIPSEDEYLNIIAGKTASLFEVIIQNVAILSESDENDAKIFGKNFGIVFQIKNDMEPESKAIDKLNQTETALSIFGVEKTSDLIDNYKKELREQIMNFPNKEYSKALEDLVNEL